MADLRMERVLWRHGYAVVGVDEAGRGPLAGPVVAGAAILPEGAILPGVNDSKQLSEKKREIAYAKVIEVALGWGVGVVDHQRIDQINIRNATFEAMFQAAEAALAMARARGVAALEKPCLLIDGNA
ncbi:MAG TPA: ribonuclease HII, partial [Symbiobacteriaceae bacterium]|nr:ribonuclease HII [Symbiobacteriaceae bacterium]